MDLVKDPATVIIELHLKCMLSVKNSLELAIDVGEHLAEQKEAMDHGTFTPWIEETLPFSVRTAQNYIKIAARKEELLQANVDNLTEAYLLIAPPKEADDVHIHKNPTHEEDSQDSQYTYWDHLGPLVDKMNKVYERLAALRDGTTPKGIGHLIGNIKEMADVLNSWKSENLEDCPTCSDGNCGICINGKIGIYQESDN